ncbi:MAG: M20/M25/M40 family metallo-hydrolase [Candidatus Thorarchaeota archaeon]
MEVSIERIKETVDGLCKYRNRIAGTKAERQAADYLKRILGNIGYEVLEHEFPIIAWEPKEAYISVAKPDERPIECALFPNSPDAEHKAVLVDLESIQEDGERNFPLFGFAEWGESLYTSPDTPYNKAIDAGLDGLVISSPDEGELLKVRVGNRGRQLQIPIFSVSKESGIILKEMMKKGEVILDTKCISKRGPSKSFNLEANLEGSEPDFDIIVSAHYDAWFSGASDNAAPVAIVIEAARQLREYVQQGGTLKRTVRFLLYGAEESGSERFYFWLNGSRSYVESQDSLDRFAMVVNLDSVGYHATNFVGATYELLDFAQSITSTIKQEERFSHYCPPADGSDHWFFTIGGVPTIYLISWPSHLYHTQNDVPTALDFESIHAYAKYVVQSVTKFSNSKVMPLDIMTQFKFVKEGINEFSKIEGNPFGTQEVSDLLTNILNNKDALEQLVLDANESGLKEDSARVNDFLLTTSRRLNRTIGQVGGVHEASYLSRLTLVQEYVELDSIIRDLEEKPYMKVHPRVLDSLRTYDDTPSKLLDITNAGIELRMQCDKLGEQIKEEIINLANHLREIQSDLDDLMT